MAVNQSVRAALDICKCLYLCIMTAGIYSCDVAPWPPFLSGAGLTDPTPSPASHTPRGVLTRCWLSFEVSRFRPATQLCGLIDSKIGSVCVAGVGGWWSGVGGVIEGGAKYSGSRSEWVGRRSQLPCMHSGSTCAHTYTRVRAPQAAHAWSSAQFRGVAGGPGRPVCHFPVRKVCAFAAKCKEQHLSGKISSVCA